MVFPSVRSRGRETQNIFVARITKENHGFGEFLHPIPEAILPVIVQEAETEKSGFQQPIESQIVREKRD